MAIIMATRQLGARSVPVALLPPSAPRRTPPPPALSTQSSFTSLSAGVPPPGDTQAPLARHERATPQRRRLAHL